MGASGSGNTPLSPNSGVEIIRSALRSSGEGRRGGEREWQYSDVT